MSMVSRPPAFVRLVFCGLDGRTGQLAGELYWFVEFQSRYCTITRVRASVRVSLHGGNEDVWRERDGNW